MGEHNLSPAGEAAVRLALRCAHLTQEVGLIQMQMTELNHQLKDTSEKLADALVKLRELDIKDHA